MAASTGTGNYDAVVQAYNANDSAFISTGHTVTLTDNVTGCNFFRIDAGATLVGGGFSITIDNDSSDNSFINNGTISGVLDVIITNPNGQSNFNANGQGGNVRNLTVNNAGAVVTLSGEDQTLDGNLTITTGELTTNDGSADRDLTVTGDCIVGDGAGSVDTSVLTGNASAISLGSLVINSDGKYDATSGTTTITNEKSGHAWKNNGGTFTHNNGKVLVDFDTGNLAGDTEVKENTFYDLEVKLDSAAYELRLEDHSSTNAMDILNNLTVTKGIFDTKTKSDTLTLHGQTIIESDGVFTEADHDTNKIIHNGIVRNSGTYKINDGTTVKMNAGIRNLGTITVA